MGPMREKAREECGRTQHWAGLMSAEGMTSTSARMRMCCAQVRGQMRTYLEKRDDHRIDTQTNTHLAGTGISKITELPVKGLENKSLHSSCGDERKRIFMLCTLPTV